MSEQVIIINDLLAILNGFAAFDLAASWDNVGLMVGDPGKPLTGVIVALDPTVEVLDEAIDLGVNTIVTQHPCIFSPIKAVRTDLPAGRFLEHALRNGLAVIGCHTNLDVVAGVVSDILAVQLGLVDVLPLSSGLTAEQNGGQVAQEKLGFGRIGRLVEPLSPEDMLNRFLAVLELPAVRVAGSLPLRIERVAVCGGSGSDLAETAFNLGADLFLTGEVKHSTARWAESIGFCIVDAGHYSTENLAVSGLVDLLRREFAVRSIALKIVATSRQGNPFRMYIRKV